VIGRLSNFDVLHRRGRWGVVELEPLACGIRLLVLSIIVIVFSGSVKQEQSIELSAGSFPRDAPQLDAAMTPAPG
jgi:hypothetical protein